MYQEFHARGFVIVGISIDEERRAAERAVSKAALPWAEICDGQGENGPLVKLFNARGIPVSYLIGRDGAIAGKSLGASELTKKISELLEK